MARSQSLRFSLLPATLLGLGVAQLSCAAPEGSLSDDGDEGDRSSQAAVCYRLPFSNPNLDDGWGSTDYPRTNPHRGVDFPQAAGTPIPAVADGIVRRVPYSSCLGNVVVVQHADGMYSGYSHMLYASSLADGTRVSKGQTVGLVGNEGTCSRGAHLHLTMAPTVTGYSYGDTVDPYKYIISRTTCSSPRAKRGDVTGDGRADLVSVSNGRAYVWPGLSSGGFGAAVSSFAGSLDSAMIDGIGHAFKAVVDVTGDGRADLVSTRDGTAYVWPGESDGGFGAAKASFGGTLSDSARVVGVADVTGDGKADMVATLSGTAYVWPGQSDGSFGGSTKSFSGTLSSTTTIVGLSDVTGDGRADLVGRAGGTVFVWPGQSSGAFGSAVASFAGTLGSAHQIVDVADVNGDGRADLVSVNTDKSAYVWPGTSTGAFGSVVKSFNGTLDASNVDRTGHYIVGVADITGDGRGDLLSVHPDGRAYVWPGTSSLGFGSAVASFSGTLDTSNVDDSGHYIVGPSGRIP